MGHLGPYVYRFVIFSPFANPHTKKKNENRKKMVHLLWWVVELQPLWKNIINNPWVHCKSMELLSFRAGPLSMESYWATSCQGLQPQPWAAHLPPSPPQMGLRVGSGGPIRYPCMLPSLIELQDCRVSLCRKLAQLDLLGISN